MQTSGLQTRQHPSQPFSSAADKQPQTACTEWEWPCVNKALFTTQLGGWGLRIPASPVFTHQSPMSIHLTGEKSKVERCQLTCSSLHSW